MAESVRELIIQHVQATLQRITVEAGYSVTLQSVQRLMQGGQTYDPPMAMVSERDDSPIDQTAQESSGTATERTMEIGIGLVVQQDESTDARPASQVMNGLLADVQRAMEADVSRGGHAINTTEIGLSPIEVVEGMPELEAGIAYTIRYRHLRTDPRVNV